MNRSILICGMLLALPLAACNNDPAARLDVDAGDDMAIAPEEAVTLSATATGGTAPYTFRWSVERQPANANLSLDGQEIGQTISPGVLNVTGEYQFRVRVTDAAGSTDSSHVRVSVGGDFVVTATARDILRTVGESTPIEAAIDGDTTGFTDKRFAWQVVSGEATVADPDSPDTSVTIDAERTVRLRVTVTVDDEGEEKTGIAALSIAGVRDATPQVVIENTGGVEGQIVLELFGDNAPQTVANFLHYVDDGYYDGLVWHRVDAGFVIQTGAYERAGTALQKRPGARPPIKSEANNGRTNIRGAVGLALRGTDPDSGDSQFFVNLVDNPSLDSGSPAYTVFGRVVAGLEEVVDTIADVDVGADSSGLTDVPLTDIIMQSITRAETEIPTDGGSNGPLIEIDLSAEADDPLLVVGESTQLRAIVEDPPTGLNFTWTVISGTATFDDSTSATPRVTIGAPNTTQLRVTARGDGVKVTSADAFVVGVENATPRVIITNTGAVEGEIVFELLTEAAPITCANFLRYVDDRFFDGVVWHRVVSNFVIQGGAFEADSTGLVEKPGKRDPIPSEADNGESNLRATVAMALQGVDADSGTNQFFINLKDNSGLDTGPPPFTVFARVVEGMDVADEIGGVPTGTDGNLGLADAPIDPIFMSRVRREIATPGGDLGIFASAANVDLAARAFHRASLLDTLDDPIAIITGGVRAGAGGSLTSLDTVSFFDPHTNSFSDMFTPPDGDGPVSAKLFQGRSAHMQLTLRNGDIFIAGGEVNASGASLGTPTNTVEVFEHAVGEMVQRTPMAVVRGRGHAATRMPAARLIVSGGSTWEVYTASTDTWEGPFDLGRERLGHAAVTVVDIRDDGDIFTNPDHRALLIGGAGTGPNTCEMLQPDDGSVEVMASTLSRNLRDVAAINLDTETNIILIVGGVDLDTGSSVSDAFLLDIDNDTIETIDPLPDRPGGAARQQIVLLAGRYAVVFGGEEVQGGVGTELSYYAIFDHQTDSWVESGSMQFARTNFAAVATGDSTALLVGGSAAGDPLTDIRDDGEVFTLDVDDIGTNGG